MSATIEQSLDSLDKVLRRWTTLQKDPTINPRLVKKNHGWTICLEEVWPDGEPYGKSSQTLDKRVAWVSEEMPKWSGVRRLAWDMWAFDDKRQAEKFITLYQLIWAQ